MSQQDLADRIGLDHHQTIGKIERGEQRLRLDQLPLFADALNIDLWQLLTDEPAPFGLPVRYVVAAALSNDAPAWNDPTVPHILTPPRLPAPEECFAAEIADDSADLIYPKGSFVIARCLEKLAGPLKLGAKVLVAQYGTDLENGDIFAVLVGFLDRTVIGETIVATRSHNIRTPKLITIQPRTATAGASERILQFEIERSPTIDYRPRANDPARILGVIERAVTVE